MGFSEKAVNKTGEIKERGCQVYKAIRVDYQTAHTMFSDSKKVQNIVLLILA